MAELREQRGLALFEFRSQARITAGPDGREQHSGAERADAMSDDCHVQVRAWRRAGPVGHGGLIAPIVWSELGTGPP